MSDTTEILQHIRYILKYYEKTMKGVCLKHDLLQIEVNILTFLHNHPDKDTASDIIEIRMLPKGNVSQSVDRLIQKGLVSKKTDAHDRRRIHLSLTSKAQKIIPDIVAARNTFEQQLFKNITFAEKEVCQQLMNKMMANAFAGLGKSGQEEELE